MIWPLVSAGVTIAALTIYAVVSSRRLGDQWYRDAMATDENTERIRRELDQIEARLRQLEHATEPDPDRWPNYR